MVGHQESFTAHRREQMRSLAEAQISRRSETKRATAKSFFARPSPRHPSRDSLASLRARGFGHAFVSHTRFDLAIWVHRSTRRLLVMDESILSAAEAAHSPSGQSARTDLGEKDVAEARNSSTSESSLRNEASGTPLGKKGAEGSDS